MLNYCGKYKVKRSGYLEIFHLEESRNLIGTENFGDRTQKLHCLLIAVCLK